MNIKRCIKKNKTIILIETASITMLLFYFTESQYNIVKSSELAISLSMPITVPNILSRNLILKEKQ